MGEAAQRRKLEQGVLAQTAPPNFAPPVEIGLRTQSVLHMCASLLAVLLALVSAAAAASSIEAAAQCTVGAHPMWNGSGAYALAELVCGEGSGIAADFELYDVVMPGVRRRSIRDGECALRDKEECMRMGHVCYWHESAEWPELGRCLADTSCSDHIKSEVAASLMQRGVKRKKSSDEEEERGASCSADDDSSDNRPYDLQTDDEDEGPQRRPLEQLRKLVEAERGRLFQLTMEGRRVLEEDVETAEQRVKRANILTGLSAKIGEMEKEVRRRDLARRRRERRKVRDEFERRLVKAAARANGAKAKPPPKGVWRKPLLQTRPKGRPEQKEEQPKSHGEEEEEEAAVEEEAEEEPLAQEAEGAEEEAAEAEPEEEEDAETIPAAELIEIRQRLQAKKAQASSASSSGPPPWRRSVPITRASSVVQRAKQTRRAQAEEDGCAEESSGGGTGSAGPSSGGKAPH